MEAKIKARIILEMVGGPKEYVEKIMEDLVKNKLTGEKNIKVVSDIIHPIEQMDKLFTTFAEVELETDEVRHLMNFCFDYMPSSIEILEPTSFDLKALDFVDLFNDLLARLHKADMVVKQINAQNIVLRKEVLKYKENKN